MRRSFTILLLIIIPAAWLGPAAFAQAAPAEAHPFTIGYLLEGSDFALEAPGAIASDVMMQSLRAWLETQPAVNAAIAAAGFDGIQLSPGASPGDLVQRMATGEFHLVFATAVAYSRLASHQGPTPAASYQPVLQSRRPGDVALGPDGGVMRQGVLIQGPASPLFESANPSTEALAKAFAASPLAVPSADSAPGFIFPRLTLLVDFSLRQPGEFWFCGSDGEVVKHVLTGLAPFGACREGALDAVRREAGIASAELPSYLRVLFKTAAFPTDPILLRGDLAPARTDLGRELKPALRRFFNEVQRLDPDLRVSDADPRSYEGLARTLDRLPRLFGPGGEPALPSAAPALPAAEPTPDPRPALPPLP